MKNTLLQKQTKGQSLVEAALLFPLVLMLLLGLADFGRAYYVVVALRDAADEGATYAALRPSDIDGIQLRTSEAAQGMVQLTPEAVAVVHPDTMTAGAPVTVRVEYEMAILTPFVQGFFPDHVMLLHGEATHSIITAR
ncbi:MAG: pilus assembly protein [Anaerolineae bacterium]|nr:pilus assembly protein [Anaerolineae bacterium]